MPSRLSVMSPSKIMMAATRSRSETFFRSTTAAFSCPKESRLTLRTQMMDGSK